MVVKDEGPDLRRWFNRAQNCKQQIAILKRSLLFWQKELKAALDAMNVQQVFDLNEMEKK